MKYGAQEEEAGRERGHKQSSPQHEHHHAGADEVARTRSQSGEHKETHGGAVSVAGSKLGHGPAIDDDMQDEDDDIAPPYVIDDRPKRSIAARVGGLCSSILTHPLYPPLLYAACLVDAILLWLEGATSQALAFPLRIGIDLIFWTEFCLKIVSFGVLGNTSTTIEVYEQGAEVVRVVDSYLAQRWYACHTSTAPLPPSYAR